jgi:hypothetical protein
VASSPTSACLDQTCAAKVILDQMDVVEVPDHPPCSSGTVAGWVVRDSVGDADCNPGPQTAPNPVCCWAQALAAAVLSAVGA